MGNPVLQLSNAANWQDIYSREFQAQIISDKAHIPIPEVTIPILLDRHILAIYANSMTAKRSWDTAGYLKQKISLGLITGGAPDAEVIHSRRIGLRRITLVTFPKLTTEYGLGFNAPFWLRDINLTIWKYVGAESDSTEDLIQRVRDDLVRIEFKIDEQVN